MSGSERTALAASRRWVIKVGSALLTNEGRGLDAAMIGSLVAQIAALRAEGAEVVLVSSGAVAAGVVRLGWPRRPTRLHE
ncbi:MAG: glutamate 5-kinase, partial [Haliea sp.]|nr:glutamate 5-kinase [Haliea sp.]